MADAEPRARREILPADGRTPRAPHLGALRPKHARIGARLSISRAALRCGARGRNRRPARDLAAGRPLAGTDRRVAGRLRKITPSSAFRLFPTRVRGYDCGPLNFWSTLAESCVGKECECTCRCRWQP